VGVSRDCPIFSGTPYYLRNGKSYGFQFQIWPVHSEAPSGQKPIKIFGGNGAWAYPGTTQFFSDIPYYLRNRKSYGFQTWPGTVQFFRVPLIISGTEKASIFKFCTHIYRLNRNKSPLKISGKVVVGIARDSRNFSGHPYIWRIARSSLR